ncbi:MAG: oligosaccharide flippase family protein [Bacteroidaceae bacterium]|nr:oligosaccharide flippase family protein [Bacteroidaceae bacterium]
MLNVSRYKILLSNFGYLSILNGLNIILPLLTIPYLTNVVGAEHFGDYMFVLVLVQNIEIITNFGFQFSATKTISRNRDDMGYVARLTSSVIASRLVIGLLVLCLLLLFKDFIFRNDDQQLLFYTSLGMIFGDVFIPVWLFQGLERMKYVTIVNATAKLLFCALVFIIVRESDDFRYILLLNSCGYVVAGVLSMVLVRQQFHLHLPRPQLGLMSRAVRKSVALFLSNVGISLYRNVNVLILNYFVPNSSVGIYGTSEKIVKAAQSLVTPLSQALFPNLGYKLKQEGGGPFFRFFWRTVGLLSFCLLLLAILLWWTAPWIAAFMGKDFSEVSGLLAMMLPVLFFGCMNYLLGFVGLVNLGYQRYFFHCVFASGTIALVFLFLTVQNWGIQSAAMAISLSEFVLTILCIVKLVAVYQQMKAAKKA